MCKISHCNLNLDSLLPENDFVKWLYQSQMKEQPSKSAKSGSFGADKPLVGQTDVNLTFRWLGVGEMEEYPIFIYKALLLRCLLVQIYTAGYCYSMAATLAATCIHCPCVTLSITHALDMSIISPGKGIIKIFTNTDPIKVRSKSISQHIIPRTRCFKIVFKPKHTGLPGRQRWCQNVCNPLDHWQFLLLVSVP